ncbi:hypothetical protein Tco_0979731 [Tanacetum coccineum]
MNAGTTTLHSGLEKVVADFVGKPAALVAGMGYGGLIISDFLNLNSIVNGARGSDGVWGMTNDLKEKSCQQD